MIKKTLDIKVTFKTYFKILKTFKFVNGFLFYEIKKNYSKFCFFVLIFYNDYQIEELIIKLAKRIHLNLMKWLAKRD